MRPLLYVLVFTAGFAVMLVEITAPRLLGPFFGTSAHVWTNVIGVILAALSIGYYVGGRLADRRPDPALLAMIVMWGCAITALTPFAVPWIGRWVLPGELGLGQAYDILRYGSLVTAVCVFFPPALLLAVVGPFTIRCLSDGDQVGRSAGTVFAVGTVGSLVGTFLPTFVLIPWLGSRATVLGATALLFLVALVVYVAGRKRALAAAPAAALLVAAAVAVGMTPLRPAAPGETLVAEGESAYQYVRVSRVEKDGTTQLRLQVNEPVTDYHSLWVPGRVLTGSYYDHYTLLPWMLAPEADGRKLSVLILGLAGGVISRQYHMLFPERIEAIDGVEVDPLVIELSRRHFGLEKKFHPKLDVHVLDGRLFLRAAPRRYDLVIVDAYAHQIYMPPHMTTVAFFEEVKAVMKPGGIVALNASAYAAGVGLVPRLVNTVARVFGRACLGEACPGNYVLFAYQDRRAGWPPTRKAAELPEAIRPLWLRFSAPRHVLRFDDDRQAAVFTDDDCPAEMLATRDLERAAAWAARR